MTTMQLLATSLAVTTALLPVIGVVMRGTAFLLDGRVPVELALTAPIGQLAGEAAYGIGPYVLGLYLTLVILSPFAPFMRKLTLLREKWEGLAVPKDLEPAVESVGAELKRLHEEKDRVVALPNGQEKEAALNELLDATNALEKKHEANVAVINAAMEGLEEIRREIDVIENEMPAPRLRRILGLVPDRILDVIIWSLLAVAVVTLPAPTGVLGIAAGLVMGYSVGRHARRTGTLGIWDLWPLFVLILGFGALVSGMALTTGRPALMRFEEGTSVGDGWYAEVARNDSILYLLSCDDPDRAAIGVPISLLRSLEYSESTPPAERDPSLVEIALLGAPVNLGLDARCPDGPER